mmetsp:Transcript_42497/g.85511  ORF Transcript_42497/g.85511 Transcript_42497/m.85511 type:complete len:302 (+) Transcript_42497:40-945(+)
MTCGTETQPSTHGLRGSLLESAAMANDSLPNEMLRIRHPLRSCAIHGRTWDSPTFLICPHVYSCPIPSTAAEVAPPAATRSKFLIACGPEKKSTLHGRLRSCGSLSPRRPYPLYPHDHRPPSSSTQSVCLLPQNTRLMVGGSVAAPRKSLPLMSEVCHVGICVGVAISRKPSLPVEMMYLPSEPCPSVPNSGWPHESTLPSSVTIIENSTPAPTSTTLLPRVDVIALGLSSCSVVLPIPSSPNLLDPQTQTSPAAVKNNVWVLPTAALDTLRCSRPLISVGAPRFPRSPTPSCPLSFRPKP